jgi:hypothetical protein
MENQDINIIHRFLNKEIDLDKYELNVIEDLIKHREKITEEYASYFDLCLSNFQSNDPKIQNVRVVSPVYRIPKSPSVSVSKSIDTDASSVPLTPAGTNTPAVMMLVGVVPFWMEI